MCRLTPSHVNVLISVVRWTVFGPDTGTTPQNVGTAGGYEPWRENWHDNVFSYKVCLTCPDIVRVDGS